MVALRVITCAAVAGSVAGTVNLDIEDSFNADPEGNAPINFGVVSSAKLAPPPPQPAPVPFNTDPDGNAPVNLGVLSSGKLAQHEEHQHNSIVPPEKLPSYYLTKDSRVVQKLSKSTWRVGPTEESLDYLHACESARFAAPATVQQSERCGVCTSQMRPHLQPWQAGFTVVYCSVDGTKIYRQWYEDSGCTRQKSPTPGKGFEGYLGNGEKDVARREDDCQCEEPKAKYECTPSAHWGQPCRQHWVKQVSSGDYYILPPAPALPPPRPAPAPPPPRPAPAPASWAQRALVADEGSNLKSLNSVTPDDCKAECEALTACHSFAFSESKRRCHLKDKCVTQSDATDHGNPGHVGYVTHYKLCKQDEVLV